MSTDYCFATLNFYTILRIANKFNINENDSISTCLEKVKDKLILENQPPYQNIINLINSVLKINSYRELNNKLSTKLNTNRKIKI